MRILEVSPSREAAEREAVVQMTEVETVLIVVAAAAFP